MGFCDSLSSLKDTIVLEKALNNNEFRKKANELAKC